MHTFNAKSDKHRVTMELLLPSGSLDKQLERIDSYFHSAAQRAELSGHKDLLASYKISRELLPIVSDGANTDVMLTQGQADLLTQMVLAVGGKLSKISGEAAGSLDSILLLAPVLSYVNGCKG